MSRSEQAAERFLHGCNCAQAVFTAFCEELGVAAGTGMKLACPFGGGMSHTGEVCGAVTGALLVIGLNYGPENAGSADLKAKTMKIAQNFCARFRERCGSVSCTELLEYDLSDASQLDEARQAGVFETKCPGYVKIAVELLEAMLAETEAAE